MGLIIEVRIINGNLNSDNIRIGELARYVLLKFYNDWPKIVVEIVEVFG